MTQNTDIISEITPWGDIKDNILVLKSAPENNPVKPKQMKGWASHK